MDFDNDNSDSGSWFSGFSEVSDVSFDNNVNASISSDESSAISDISDSDIDVQSHDSDTDDAYSDFSDAEENSELSEIPESQNSWKDEAFWSSNLEQIDIYPFIMRSGPNHVLGVNASPVEYAQLFLEQSFFEECAVQTNLYAQQKGPDQKWHPTSVEEIKAFIGLNILMGVNQLPSYRLYWSSDPFIGNNGFKGAMSVNRFAKIHQYFHLNDNTTEVKYGMPGYDRLHKIRPFLDTVKKTFKEMYSPRQNQTVDEAMVKYKGRYSMKQYMPSKPIKRGFKIWMRCDAESGYCHALDLYMGKHDPNRGPQLSQKVVKLLVKDLKGKNHHIFFDRFFTSVNLLQILERNGIYACGTIKQNSEGFPYELRKPSRLARGESIVRQHNNLVATVWQDKKQVHFLSTNSDPFGDGSTFRRLVDGSRIEVSRPPSVGTYHKYMGGVDRNNQLRAKNPVGRPSKKWWQYFFFYLVNLCITNAFIVMKDTDLHRQLKKRYTLLDFRVDVAKGLISNFSTRLHQIHAQVQQRIHRVSKLAHPRTRCKWCTKRGEKRRKETVYGCIQCNINLCKAGCFQAYHTFHGFVCEE